MSVQDLRSRKSTLLRRYQPGAGSQDPIQHSNEGTPIARSTSQRSLQNSSLLQKYYSKTNTSDLGSELAIQPNISASEPNRSGSQRSLDKSKLLQRYYKQNSTDAQDIPVAEPQRYSSQKSLETSKFMQRYNVVNHSQEFTGLAPRESTPVARFARSGSLDHDKLARSSLLSKYTPRFGKSLDRNKVAPVTSSYSNYSSQQSLDQQNPIQPIGDYAGDHYDQYDARNIRSRSSSMARGLNTKSLSRDVGPSEKENIPLDTVTPETLPVVATSVPIMGNIASALPMPMLSAVTPTPIFEFSQPIQEPIAEPMQPLVSLKSIIESDVPKSKEPVKPPRKDLAPMTTVSMPIPNIKTTITVEPPTPIIPLKMEAPVVLKAQSPPPPLFSSRDRMEHYGGATIPSPSSPSQSPSKQQAKSSARNTPSKNDTLLLPVSDLSSRRSLTDLRQTKDEPNNTFTMEIDEFSDRLELSTFTKRKNSIKSTLASAFEQIAVLSVPQVSHVLEHDEEKIESLPSDRKLKKRDHTYHPSFVPKQAKLEENERKKQEEKAKHELHKQEQQRKKEDEKLKRVEEKQRKDNEKHKKEEEKHRKEVEKKSKVEEEKRMKEAERHAKEEEKRLRDMLAKEEEKRLKGEEKHIKEEEKRIKEEEKRKREEEKRKQKEEKKKSALQKKTATDINPPVQPEEEILEFGNHLEQYSFSTPAQQRSISVGRPRSVETARGSQGALNRHTLPVMSSPPIFGSQQSLDRRDGIQSKMLQRYAKRSGSQDFSHSADIADAQKFLKHVHLSQGGLDHQRVDRPSLLQKYTPKPLSASTTTGGQTTSNIQSATPKSTSQVSLDKSRVEKSSLLQRYKPRSESADGRVTKTGEPRGHLDKDQRMATVEFTQKKLSNKSTLDYRDHEYEPIGEPVEEKTVETKAAETKGSLLPPTDNQNRKLSSASLRVPADEGDTISMEELQKDIEDRYFNRPTDEEAMNGMAESTEAEATHEKTSKVKAAMVRAQEGGKKAMARAQESSRNAMVKAQEGSKSLHQKLRKQTDKFKTKMSNINIKKDKDVAPLASPEIVTTPEIEKLDFTIAEPKPEQETGEIEQPSVQTDTTEQEIDESVPENATPKKKSKGADFGKLKNIHIPKIQKPEFKRPEFTKISKPKMPKLKTPDMSKFKRPEMPKFFTEKPDFSKIKMPDKLATIRIQRSKSMKEPALSGATSAASPSDVETPSVIGTDSTKKKVDYTDFSTFPRLLDKFKRQKSTPSNVSVRASTPPPLEFSKAGKTSRSKGTGFISRWAEKSSEDTGSTRFFTGSELGERDGSVERRMRQQLERAELETPDLPITAEQKQLEEYDKENREIHLLSAARHDEFMKRKPPMERQESDLASEEEKQFWASSLGQKIRQNIDMNSNDFDFLDEEDRLRTARESETMGLSANDRARFLGESIGEHSEKDYDMRSTTPYSNKECQSSGSSGIRRRKGVIEEIDDDEFFLRQKGISKDNIQMGEYISSAIKEGLSTPKNALAEMGRYDPYYDDEADASERMSMEYRVEQGPGGRFYQPSFESDDMSSKQGFADEFRKQADFYKTFSPDRPMRKHKKSFNNEQYDEEDNQKVPYDSYQQKEEEEEEDEANMDFYDRDRKYGSGHTEIHIEQRERFMDEESVGNGFSRTGTAVPPTPPRRRKKRFRDVTPSDLAPFGNGLTSKPIYNSFTLGPETHIFNSEVPLAQEESFTTPLPTPRRSRSRSQISKLDRFEDDRTSRGAESYIFGAEDSAPVKHSIDMSDTNGYAIVRKEPPPRPPAPIRRRKSTRSLGDQRQFSTLPNFHSVSPARPSRNYSTINPNRPPRGRSISSLNENQPQFSRISREDITQYEVIEAIENQAKIQQQLQSGEVVKKMKDRPLPPPPRPPRDSKKSRKFDQDDRHDFDGGAERITSFGMLEARVIQEVDIAIQTDPVSEDFDLDIEVSETMDEVEQSTKTLQHILKQEQQAEIDRARQLAEASNLMRDIQKFRESTSSLSQHSSRPETPSAMSFERRVSAPSTTHIMPSLSSENLTEQDLANIDDDKFIAELVQKYVSEEKVTESSKKIQRESDELKRNYSSGTMNSTKQHDLESFVVQEKILNEEIRPVQSEPSAPPRRRSLVLSTPDIPASIGIPSNVIEEIVERLRTNEQHHIAELEQLHQQQLEYLRKEQEQQRKLQEQKLEEQQKILLEQQSQQLQETQQLKEQILQQQEQQTSLLLQQQQQQQQLLLAQQQQQLLIQQQEKERELQRERERELLREREIELEKARDRERELHHARELELQRARELEQQRAREIEQQRLRELELQHTMELEHQRLRELEMQRAQEAEIQRAREAELQRAREVELQKIREHEMQRAQEIEMKIKDIERRLRENQTTDSPGLQSVDEKSETVAELLRTQEVELSKLKEIERRMRETRENEPCSAESKSETIEKEMEETTEQTIASPEEHLSAEQTPMRPPPPRISSHIPVSSQLPYQEYLPYAIPPQPFYQTRNYSDAEGAYPQVPHRRRRHHRSRRESTSEEEFHREQRKQRHETRSPEPSIPALGSQLIRACGNSIRETGDELMTILRASSKDENKRDLHIALIVLIVIVAGLMALGMSGEKSVHHHHWDYFNPPGSSGNA